ncbi:MAG: S41 family peptidase [Gammaproteobacteria bacterium]|nr:S41 family peptidase [Gammaproteobacteria bacterium]
MTFFNISKYFKFFIFFLFAATNTAIYAQTDAEEAKLKEFFSIYNYIQQLYVDEVEGDNLFGDAIKGMVNGLDPHSNYLEPSEQKDLVENATGKFGGLGIVITKKDDAIQVISPIDDTPAYRAGIQAGDLIVKIGNSLVSDMTLEEGVELMRGMPETSVELTIVRENTEPFVININREIITIITVKGFLIEKDIGYIRISAFQEPTGELLKSTIEDLNTKNGEHLKSLIIDLRNNPGGTLNGAVDVSNLFIDKEGLVVYTKGRIPSSNTEFETEPGDIMHNRPIVVLINEGSASASEIVAGALQDHSRAIIMGNTSFGKGSVQTVIELRDGFGLKLTTARYYTPSGRSIQAKGIEPDIFLKNINLENEDEQTIANTKEKDLDGHLEVEDPSKLSPDEILQSQENIKEENDNIVIARLKKDYFIHEASNLLKALTILNQ